MKGIKDIDSCRNCFHWIETCTRCHNGWCTEKDQEQAAMEVCEEFKKGSWRKHNDK